MDNKLQRQKAAKEAIAIFGSSAALAKELGLERATVNAWKKTGIPTCRCGRIEELTGVLATKLDPNPYGYLDKLSVVD